MRVELKRAAKVTNQEYHGIHGYAAEKYGEYIRSGMNNDQALLAVAEDLGHHRSDITLVYLKIRY
jgi:hypothetical protein